MNIRIHIDMGKYAYTNADTNICRLTGFSLAFISFRLMIKIIISTQ